MPNNRANVCGSLALLRSDA